MGKQGNMGGLIWENPNFPRCFPYRYKIIFLENEPKPLHLQTDKSKYVTISNNLCKKNSTQDLSHDTCNPFNFIT